MNASIRIRGDALANLPWEPEPAAGLRGPIWRYSQNPVIPRDLIPTSNSIFNSAAVPYEGRFAGDVPNVCFPCAALADASTGRITIYYGCADTVTGLAFTRIEPLFDYIRKNSSV